MWRNVDILRPDVPPNWPQWYRALLHHVFLTCGRMLTYPGQMYPYPLLIDPSGTEPSYTMSVWDVEACRHTQVRWYLPLITLSATEPYYTMSVWHVEECRHTQVRYTTPLMTLVVQSPTTPCQFDMWKNAGIPRSDVHPPLIEPSATESYYITSVWYVKECRCTKVRCNPHPGHWTQCYRALLNHVSLTCGRMQVYPGQMYTPH